MVVEVEEGGFFSRVNAQEIQLSRQQDVSKNPASFALNMHTPASPPPGFPANPLPPFSHSPFQQHRRDPLWAPFAGPPFHTLLSQRLICLREGPDLHLPKKMKNEMIAKKKKEKI